MGSFFMCTSTQQSSRSPSGNDGVRNLDTGNGIDRYQRSER